MNDNTLCQFAKIVLGAGEKYAPIKDVSNTQPAPPGTEATSLAGTTPTKTKNIITTPGSHTTETQRPPVNKNIDSLNITDDDIIVVEEYICRSEHKINATKSTKTKSKIPVRVSSTTKKFADAQTQTEKVFIVIEPEFNYLKSVKSRKRKKFFKRGYKNHCDTNNNPNSRGNNNSSNARLKPCKSNLQIRRIIAQRKHAKNRNMNNQSNGHSRKKIKTSDSSENELVIDTDLINEKNNGESPVMSNKNTENVNNIESNEDALRKTLDVSNKYNTIRSSSPNNNCNINKTSENESNKFDDCNFPFLVPQEQSKTLMQPDNHYLSNKTNNICEINPKNMNNLESSKQVSATTEQMYNSNGIKKNETRSSEEDQDTFQQVLALSELNKALLTKAAKGMQLIAAGKSYNKFYNVNVNLENSQNKITSLNSTINRSRAPVTSSIDRNNTVNAPQLTAVENVNNLTGNFALLNTDNVLSNQCAQYQQPATSQPTARKTQQNIVCKNLFDDSNWNSQNQSCQATPVDFLNQPTFDNVRKNNHDMPDVNKNYIQHTPTSLEHRFQQPSGFYQRNWTASMTTENSFQNRPQTPALRQVLQQRPLPSVTPAMSLTVPMTAATQLQVPRHFAHDPRYYMHNTQQYTAGNVAAQDRNFSGGKYGKIQRPNLTRGISAPYEPPPRSQIRPNNEQMQYEMQKRAWESQLQNYPNSTWSSYGGRRF